MITNKERQAGLHVLGNEIIMDYLRGEALEQVASDIRAKTGSGTTAKAVSVLLNRGKDRTIVDRYYKYLAAGVTACIKLRLESLANN